MSSQEIYDGQAYRCQLCNQLLRMPRFPNGGYAAEVEINHNLNEKEETATNIVNYQHKCPRVQQSNKVSMFENQSDFLEQRDKLLQGRTTSQYYFENQH